MDRREKYMKMALDLAEKAADSGEVPVGCVIVKDDVVVGTGENRMERDRNAQSHAEMNAMKNASETLGTWRLDGCEMYVTLEPCPMCAGAVINSRLSRIFYGAKDKRAGACGSVLNLFQEDFHHKPQIVGGVMEDDCAGILTTFFKSIRS